MRIAIALACGAAVISAVLGGLSWKWGCIFFAVIAIAFIAWWVYLKLRSRNEPYLTEIGGVIVRVDPNRDSRNDPVYYSE